MEEVVVTPASRLRRAVLAGVALAAAALAASPALAWGELGHRVVGDLAYERLTPAARTAVDLLIRQSAATGEPSCPVASLADAAAFPGCVDGVGKYNDMRRLHYDATPFCGTPPKTDWCKDGRCASEAVKRAAAALADPAQPPGARLLALEQLAHFIADIHQPMDMIDNRDDRGADIRVTLPGTADKRMNLHEFWNDVVLAPALGGEEIGVRYLEPVTRRNATWGTGTVDDWALETRVLAHALYQALPEPPMCNRNPRMPETLDRGYVAAAVATTREQLAKAGVRLASVLNATLR